MAEHSRVDEVSPWELGVHAAVPGGEGDDDLPPYVTRDFDFRLRTALAVNGVDRGAFVVLVGNSMTGKTRSMYEAVHDLVPEWALVQPADAAELLLHRSAPPRRTVFWLDQLHRYLGAEPAALAECVNSLRRAGNLVVGTLWPEQYALSTGLLKTATLVPVTGLLSGEEEQEAEAVAPLDTRIRHALESGSAGLTQALAGGPALLAAWARPPNPYFQAAVTAAADAFRLGVQSPLREALLVDAMAGYLEEPHRLRSRGEWVQLALPDPSEPGAALVRVGEGRFGGYAIASYLAQHLGRERRLERVPHETWQALVAHVRQPPDLWRLADSAQARLRCRYAEEALRRLATEFTDARAAARLADLLIRQDRCPEAVAVLVAAWPSDEIRARLARARELQQRVDAIRSRALAGVAADRERLADILLDAGERDDLRQRAKRGDRPAAERLVDLLVEWGCVRDIRRRAEMGELYAAEALCDLYAAWGDIHLLEARAEAGDTAAQLRLSKVNSAQQRRKSAEAEVAELRAAVDDGNPDAGLQLCTLLFELRDKARLSDELNAGTPGAADRLIALYMAVEQLNPEQLAQLRGFGLHADGRPVRAILL